jgi:hypothetical protein
MNKKKQMTKDEAMKKLEGKTGDDKWLVRSYESNTISDFYVITCRGDPRWHKEAINLRFPDRIETAVEWIMEVA